MENNEDTVTIALINSETGDIYEDSYGPCEMTLSQHDYDMLTEIANASYRQGQELSEKECLRLLLEDTLKEIIAKQKLANNQHPLSE